MDLIEKNYKSLVINPWGPVVSIVEHLPTLKRLASECDYVVEMGIGMIVSTWALLAGKPKSLISYDIHHPNIHGRTLDDVEKASAESGIIFKFIQKDTSKIEIDECDFLFIDSLHTYDHLKEELKLHPSKVKKYIAFHDTVTFGKIGENGGEGLTKAIEEFMEENTEWKVKETFVNNNGLLVIERI